MSIQLLHDEESALSAQYEKLTQQPLMLNLTRGKPSDDQVALSSELDGILGDDYFAQDGSDTRNYGGDICGLPEAQQLFAELLDCRADEVLVGDNSSLTLFYQALLFCRDVGLVNAQPWRSEKNYKMICLVPGYDRHFSICEQLGIEMLNMPMGDTGPDMDAVTQMVQDDQTIKGIIAVPRFSNPSGVTFDDATVRRFAELPKVAADNFCIFWDNAYAVHHFVDYAPLLLPLMDECRQQGTAERTFMFASTSKMTFAGAGVGCLATGSANLAQFAAYRQLMTVGPDKINQLRHVRLLKNKSGILALMQRHAVPIKAKFDETCNILATQLQPHPHYGAYGSWNPVQGGYFISFYTRKGLAAQVIELAKGARVKLTPAGSAFPYRRDCEDVHIRIAPTFPRLEDISTAMNTFALCVKLATIRQWIHTL